MRRSCRRPVIALIAVVALEGPLLAQASETQPLPKVMQAIVDCRELAEPAQRLACYDASVPAMQAAQARHEIVIADREQIREAKRGLFGLSLPDLKLFSNSEEDRIKEIESTIRSLSRNGRGKWVFTLEDGARWEQTDIRDIWPKPGASIRIRQAAMGSYLANINGGVAVRVERLGS